MTLPYNIYAKHGGSVFRNAYDQASNIMSGGLEGLKESIDINGQPHNLAYINPSEANLLKVLGGSGQKVNGVPAYVTGYSYGEGEGDADVADGGGDTTGIAGGTYKGTTISDEGIHGDESMRPGSGVGPGDMPFAPGEEVNWAQLQAQDWAEQVERETANKRAANERNVQNMKHGQYYKGKSTQNLLNTNPKPTEQEYKDALRDDQLSWWATEQHYGSDKTEEEKMERAELYSQEEYRDDAEFAMKVGMSPLDFETRQNQAKEAGEKGRDAEIAKQTKAHGKMDWAMAGPPEYDIFGKIKQTTEVWDLEAYLDLNEDLTQKAEDEAVISSMLGQEGIENFNSVENEFELFTGLPSKLWDMITGAKEGEVADLVRSAIASLAIPIELSAVVGLVHAFGAMVGESVLGTVEVNGNRMNLHESGKLTFGSPEDDPGFDPSSVEGGDDSGLTSLKEERLPVEEEEEEEDKGTRSIADLVKRGSSGTGTDSLLKLYQSIYGPDANPFGQDNRN